MPESSPWQPPEGALVLLFTRFPVATETFLQREVRALRELGLRVELHSLHRGDEAFAGLPVQRHHKGRLFELFWRLPLEAWRQPQLVGSMVGRLFRHRPRSWLNFWENLCGLGQGVLLAADFRRREGRWQFHAVWASMPAAAAWVAARLLARPYSFAAHAYDLYERGGDWLLEEKARDAFLVRTSTEAGCRRLEERGVERDRIVLVRRGLDRFPEIKPLRSPRTPLRLLAVGRLVPKKGYLEQVRIYAALRAAGLPFEALIVGGGPMEDAVKQALAEAGLSDSVHLMGEVSEEAVWDRHGWADVLLHTSVIAPDGDQDGFPNAIGEAMAVGTVVVATPAAGIPEVIAHGDNGFVHRLEEPQDWVATLRRVAQDDELAGRVRQKARAWVEKEFAAPLNQIRLLAALEAGWVRR
ncbi:MAG: colanic acid biosynthesis glycosyltransferase WcaL [Puniceicoccaceae bacterium]|nr:MAG: colanic acid biosynthesis glycosyltransferase WcaL [Puniceicoccaceae bacterium]